MDLHGKLLSEGMAARGHNVAIISTRHPSGAEYEERNGVRIFYLKNTVFGSRRMGWRRESVNKFFELNKHRPFEVVWSQSFDAFGLSRLHRSALKIAVIPTLHGSIEQEIRTFTRNFFSNFYAPRKQISLFAGLFFSYFGVQRPLLSFSDKIIAVSHRVSRDIKKWYGRRIADKCLVIPNGVNASTFRPDSGLRMSTRREYGITDRDILLLTLGRITHEKGHHLAIEALKQLKAKNISLKLLIVGDGEKRESLVRMVRREGLDRDVAFAGHVGNEETVRYYNSADIVLMPTLTVEGLPFVLLEAMACARPVIASRIGGNSSIISDGKNGLLFPPGNHFELADEIRLVKNDPNLARKLGARARKTVLDYYNVDQMVEKTLASLI
jgi:glycosyltransferase involved in cell wall biosynthesis